MTSEAEPGLLTQRTCEIIDGALCSAAKSVVFCWVAQKANPEGSCWQRGMLFLLPYKVTLLTYFCGPRDKATGPPRKRDVSTLVVTQEAGGFALALTQSSQGAGGLSRCSRIVQLSPQVSRRTQPFISLGGLVNSHTTPQSKHDSLIMLTGQVTNS